MAAHVAFVSPYLYPILARSKEIPIVGGGEVQQAILARELTRMGYRVSVLTGDFGQADLVELDGIRVHRLQSTKGRLIRGARYFLGLLDIYRKLKEVAPDVVYNRIAGPAAAPSALYAKLHAKKFVFASASDKEFEAPTIRHFFARNYLFFRFGLRLADEVIVQNLTQQSMLSKLSPALQPWIIPNCHQELQSLPASLGGPVIWVGMIRRPKRPEVFLELARREPSRQFIMIGGPEISALGSAQLGNDNYYLEIAAQAVTVPNIQFRGFVPYSEIGRYFDGAACLVNTSDFEGFPNTFLQSWSRGVPTLSFVDPRIDTSQAAGTIVCNDVDDMSARLRSVLGDAQAWGIESARSRQHFDRYHTAAAVMRMYSEVFTDSGKC